jgi:hypothetical protein
LGNRGPKDFTRHWHRPGEAAAVCRAAAVLDGKVDDQVKIRPAKKYADGNQEKQRIDTSRHRGGLLREQRKLVPISESLRKCAGLSAAAFTAQHRDEKSDSGSTPSRCQKKSQQRHNRDGIFPLSRIVHMAEQQNLIERRTDAIA